MDDFHFSSMTKLEGKQKNTPQLNLFPKLICLKFSLDVSVCPDSMELVYHCGGRKVGQKTSNKV
jgi:hypothetical protein